ncbi:NUDIX hydrolase, putative [Babesia ovata]|uniref:NUDIX hydrolase, putative n=1 Tax=Babesia ovata TaxID=189622 RepID=A0A2H6KEC4_9APIC|nr:NUDIX hydrolase, putative [Babesia ovata]GBE61343.1 NUDIX hydrolase, putative [Babesia ovata]
MNVCSVVLLAKVIAASGNQLMAQMSNDESLMRVAVQRVFQQPLVADPDACQRPQDYGEVLQVVVLEILGDLFAERRVELVVFQAGVAVRIHDRRNFIGSELMRRVLDTLRHHEHPELVQVLGVPKREGDVGDTFGVYSVQAVADEIAKHSNVIAVELRQVPFEHQQVNDAVEYFLVECLDLLSQSGTFLLYLCVELLQLGANMIENHTLLFESVLYYCGTGQCVEHDG